MVALAPNHHTDRWSRALRDVGFDLHVVYLPGTEPVSLPDVQLHPVDVTRPAIPVWSAAAAWHRVLDDIAPDVVYMQWLFARPAMLMALSPRWPMVITVMGSDVRQESSLGETWLERVWRTALLLRANAITAVAQPLADVVAAYDPNLARRTTIVPFGVDTDVFHPIPGGAARPADAVLRIGHFKSDDHTYGRLPLLQALEPLVRDDRGIELHLAGRRGGDGGAVNAYLRDHPHLARCVVDHGLVAVDDMPRLYHGIDLYILNSFQESFGVAAAEALASGVPVIGSDVGGVRSLVRSCDTGLLVPPGDVGALRAAILEMRDHPALRAMCASHGRERVVSRYPWQRNVDQVAALLCHAAAQGPLRDPPAPDTSFAYAN